MKRLSIFLIAITIIFASCVKDRIQPTVSGVVNTAGDSLIYFWDFNSGDSTDRDPSYGSLGTATYRYYSSYIDFTTGSDINLRAGVTEPGDALRVRNPSDSIVFVMPTTGYKEVVMKYAEQRSSSGPSLNAVYYTTDGVHYVTTALSNNSYSVDTVFEQHTFDFSADAAVNNNPKFAVKIVFTNNNTSTSGNDRFDNVSLEGKEN